MTHEQAEGWSQCSFPKQANRKLRGSFEPHSVLLYSRHRLLCLGIIISIFFSNETNWFILRNPSILHVEVGTTKDTICSQVRTFWKKAVKDKRGHHSGISTDVEQGWEGEHIIVNKLVLFLLPEKKHLVFVVYYFLQHRGTMAPLVHVSEAR